jgi:hypothetical protein
MLCYGKLGIPWNNGVEPWVEALQLLTFYDGK